MRVVALEAEDDFDGWRAAVRGLVLDQVPPDQIVWQVGGDDPKHGVAFPRRQVAFHHLGKAPDGFAEAQGHLGILRLEPDAGKDRQPRTDLGRVEPGDIAIDDPGFLEQPDTAQARRRRQPHLLCQLDIRNAPVALKHLQDMAIDRVGNDWHFIAP